MSSGDEERVAVTSESLPTSAAPSTQEDTLATLTARLAAVERAISATPSSSSSLTQGESAAYILVPNALA